MMKKLAGLLIIIMSICLGCWSNPSEPTTPIVSDGIETAVQTITLDGPVTDRNAEVSGLAWYDDHLILLPQFPDFSRRDSAIYAIPKSQILAFLDAEGNDPIAPIRIPFESNGLGDGISGFEGYESIAFSGDNAYLTIEVSGGGMKGFLVRGQIASDLSQFTIVGPRMTQIEQPITLGNRSG